MGSRAALTQSGSDGAFVARDQFLMITKQHDEQLERVGLASTIQRQSQENFHSSASSADEFSSG